MRERYDARIRSMAFRWTSCARPEHGTDPRVDEVASITRGAGDRVHFARVRPAVLEPTCQYL